jgi:hypothetical protein
MSVLISPIKSPQQSPTRGDNCPSFDKSLDTMAASLAFTCSPCNCAEVQYNLDYQFGGVRPLYRSISKRIASVCLLLTLWSVYAFAAHHHSNSTEAVKCTVCVAAHSASPVASSKLPNASFVPLCTVAAEPVTAKQRLVTFALNVRPPPEA